jgi:hypothetical protein
MSKVNFNRFSFPLLTISFILLFLLLVCFILFLNRQDSAFLGNAIGGILGTLFSLYAAIILYQTYKSQKRVSTIELFENTFFSLLRTQQEITSNIKSYFFFINEDYKKDRSEIKGREIFLASKIELQKLFKIFRKSDFPGQFDDRDLEKAKNEKDSLVSRRSTGEITSEEEYVDKLNELRNGIKESYLLSIYSMGNNKIDEKKWSEIKSLEIKIQIQEVYKIYFHIYNHVIGHYFRHLFHLINFIKEYQIKNNFQKGDVKKYIDFIQSQMSSFELMLLFYNAQIFPKMKNVLIEYNFLQNLSEDDLVYKSHNCIDDLKLLTRLELIGIEKINEVTVK